MAAGKSADKAAVEAAEELGLLARGLPTKAGKRLIEEGVLKKNVDVVQEVLRECLLEMTAVQVLVGGEWGRELDRAQVEEILAYAHAPARLWSSADFGRLLLTLNDVGLVTYSRKTGRVAILSGAPSTTAKGTGSLVTPSTPYTNKLLFSNLVRAATERLRWFDPHLDRAGLRFIRDEATLVSLREIHVLRDCHEISPLILGGA